MNYYYINTDTDALGYSPHAKWIKHDRAFTSGDYEEFGAGVLGKLELDDILFMYANQHGVVAAGQVAEFWAGSSYEGTDRLIYQHTKYTEYRISVDWYLPVVHNPISLDDLREIFDWPSRGWQWQSTLGCISDDRAERLLREIRIRA